MCYAARLHRYPAVGGPTGPSQVSRTHLAGATGGTDIPLGVADVQRDPRVFTPAGGPPAVPPPTSSVTLALGFLNQRGPAGTKAFLSAGGHTPFEMPTFPNYSASEWVEGLQQPSTCALTRCTAYSRVSGVARHQRHLQSTTAKHLLNA
jgi:hypothetical protein